MDSRLGKGITRFTNNAHCTWCANTAYDTLFFALYATLTECGELSTNYATLLRSIAAPNDFVAAAERKPPWEHFRTDWINFQAVDVLSI